MKNELMVRDFTRNGAIMCTGPKHFPHRHLYCACATARICIRYRSLSVQPRKECQWPKFNRWSPVLASRTYSPAHPSTRRRAPLCYDR
nr:hypothetical protein [Escherichia coli]